MRFLLWLGVLALAGCAGDAPTAFDRLKPCDPDDGPSDAYCGAYEAFENRETGEGRKIGLKIVLLPAFANSPEPDPVFFLAGGPGQAATELAEGIGTLFRRIRRTRDVVLVDQRGTGKDNPLACDLEPDDDSLENIFDTRSTVAKLRACLEAYEADPRRYVTSTAMDDLDEIRGWLGYDKINLYGGSYGTRAGLVYMRRHREAIRAVVLDGVAPTNMTLPLSPSRDSQRALDKLEADCLADEACGARFPGLGDKVRALIERLERDRPLVRVRHPRTGEEAEIRMRPEVVRLPLFGALYSPWMSSLVPLVVDEAAAGNFGPLLALAMAREGVVGEQFGFGMHYSILCSEDAPLAEAADVVAETEGTFLADAFLETRQETCEFWPRAAVPPEYYEPVSSQAPVLILSGDLDPVTPPRWGEAVAETLPNSRHLVVGGVGHGVLPNGCAMRLIEEFIDTTDAAALDASCLDTLRRPPFFVRPSGPETGVAAKEKGDD